MQYLPVILLKLYVFQKHTHIHMYIVQCIHYIHHISLIWTHGDLTPNINVKNFDTILNSFSVLLLESVVFLVKPLCVQNENIFNTL